jgi:hypothetical protein
MGNKRFNIWFSDEEIELIKKKSKKEKRSASNFIRFKVFQDERK